MNKSSKHKGSSTTLKYTKNLCSKFSTTTTSHTPKSTQRTIESNGNKQHKLKSIPTIVNRDFQIASSPPHTILYQNFTTHQPQKLIITDPESRLLYSASDRNRSPLKIVSKKTQRSTKCTRIIEKNKSNFTNSTQQPNDKLSQIFEHTKLVLESYKQKEEKWKKEKVKLLQQLDKWKCKKQNKNSSIKYKSKN